MKKDELVITRSFSAPKKQVWQAWTDPEMVKKWWGPKGFTAPVAEMDLRVGGKYFSCMRSPEGKDYCSTGRYEEVVPEEKLAMSDSFADEKGNVVRASHYGMSADFPLEMKIVATFEEQGAKTNLVLRHMGMPVSDQKDARQGWNQSLDKLAEVLK